jgi:hypothetical protein
MASNQRCRLVCGIGIGVGLLLIVLGIFVY